MLELKNIVKDYQTGAETVHALRGIDLRFRNCEFVSILGPSGCGKTTMLNIIGGLDGYTSGDLVINGKSTKSFKDRDWDGYRNRSVGFVFQSYNLIPHQSVLSNVELSLTLAGVSRKERRKKSIEALKKVGLGDKIHARPTQMSGGQMQRVAIARAIVNMPDIILADEPTGALDTETGIQVMEILKEISKDRLVVMVTHNPDLAEKYSTRTVTMVDGKVTGDSNPVSEAEYAELCAADKKAIDEAKKARKKEKKPSMSFFTSFMLSLKNLFTKKGRTILTSFAGSIGIIGIALIYAMSNGANTYINIVQEETLTAYPLSLQSETVELSSLIELFTGQAESGEEHGDDAVYRKTMLYSLVNSINSIETSENDLASFKTYLENAMNDPDDTTGLRDAVSGVQYTYGLDLDIYTKSVDGNIIHSDVSELMTNLIMKNMSAMSDSASSLFDTSDDSSTSSMSSMMSTSATSSYSTLFQEMLPGKDGALISDIFYSQYDLVYGSWPNDYNEVVLVLDENNEITDLSLYALGLLPEEDIQKIFDAVADKSQLEIEQKSWSYEEICNGDYRIVLPGDCYKYNSETGEYEDLREKDEGIDVLYANGIKLKVCGIIRADEDAVNTILTGSIGYTSALTEYVIEHSQESEIVKAQKENPETDIFSGLMFRSEAEKMTESEKAVEFRKYIESKSTEDKAKIYVNIMSIPTDEEVAKEVDKYVGTPDRTKMETMVMQTIGQQMEGLDESMIKTYLDAMTDDELLSLITKYAEEQVRANYAQLKEQELAGMTEEEKAAALDMAVSGYSDALCATYYDEVAEYSEGSMKKNLISLGCVDLGDPQTINIYTSTFEGKDTIEAAIAQYNEGNDELHQIKYTDYVGIIMSSITTILNAITIVLIAFVAISLVVSSIMIGVITLISVQERTKEIGILRAIGASKKNVSSMFNAETLIIGFTSGLFGVVFSALICIPANMIIHALTGIGNLSAILPLSTALILIGISMLLTLIAGIIPSRSAAKKDPVIALRTE